MMRLRDRRVHSFATRHPSDCLNPATLPCQPLPTQRSRQWLQSRLTATFVSCLVGFDSLVFGRKDSRPILLHVHHRPAVRLCFVPAFVELSDGRRARSARHSRRSSTEVSVGRHRSSRRQRSDAVDSKLTCYLQFMPLVSTEQFLLSAGAAK